MKRFLSQKSKPHQPLTVDFASYSPLGFRRIAFYSHDTMGLGHSRRNHLLAQTLVNADAQTNILMIGGAQERAVWPT